MTANNCIKYASSHHVIHVYGQNCILHCTLKDLFGLKQLAHIKELLYKNHNQLTLTKHKIE